MSRPRRVLLCHDCRAALTDEEHGHYVYQCHGCVMVEHDALRVAGTNPDHPDAERLSRSAVDLSRPQTAGVARAPTPRVRSAA